MDLKKLHETRQNIWHQMKEINDAAEDRGLSAEEQASWDKAEADLVSVDARIATLVDAETRDAAVADFVSRAGVTSTTQAAPEVDVRSQLLSGDVVNFRALTTGTAGSGGNTVPTSMGQLWETLVEQSVLLNYANVISTASGEVLDIPVATDGAAAIVAESDPVAGTDPTFAKVSLGAYKYGQAIYVPSELVSDAGVDIVGYVSRSIARALAKAFGAHLITGSGTGQPKGITTAATVAFEAGAASLTADELITLFYSVPSSYRASSSCAWLMSDSTVAELRKLKESTTGNYLWQAGFGATPDTILGKPVLADPFMPVNADTSAAANDGKLSVLFGDLNSFVVRVAGGVDVQRSDTARWLNDQVAFRGLIRIDSDLVDPAGIRVIRSADTLT